MPRSPRRRTVRKGRYRGVWWERWFRRWAAGVYEPGPPKHMVRIALFRDARDAAIARDRVLLHLGRDATALNFPSRRLAPASIEEIRQNLRQRAKSRRTSRFMGVYRRRDRLSARPWCAEVRVGDRFVFLGRWKSEREAAVAHDRAAVYLGRDRDALNFPSAAGRLRPASAEALRSECERARKKYTSSRFRGVTWLRKQRCWRARITIGGQLRHLGVFADEVEAARAYDRAAVKAFGNRARLNLGGSRGTTHRGTGSR